MYVCVRVYLIFNVSKPENSQTAWDIDMKFGTPVKQSQPFNRDYFHDNWCPIFDFMGFWDFLKNGGSRSISVENLKKNESFFFINHNEIRRRREIYLIRDVREIIYSAIPIMISFEFMTMNSYRLFIVISALNLYYWF